jgi:hypothetical protein
MSRRLTNSSNTDPGARRGQPAKVADVGAMHRPIAENLGDSPKATDQPLPLDAWKTSDLALHLIDCLKDTNAQRH